MFSSLPLFGITTTTVTTTKISSPSTASVRDAWLNERRQNKFLAEKKQKEDERFAVLTGTFSIARRQKRLSLVSSLKAKSVANFLQKSGVKKSEEEKLASRNRRRLIKAIEAGYEINLDDPSEDPFSDDEEEEEEKDDHHHQVQNNKNKKSAGSRYGEDMDNDLNNPFLTSAAKQKKALKQNLSKFAANRDVDDDGEEIEDEIKPDFYKHLTPPKHRFLAKIHDEDEMEARNPKTAREKQEELDRDYSYLLRSSEQERIVQRILDCGGYREEAENGNGNESYGSLHSRTKRRRNSSSSSPGQNREGQEQQPDQQGMRRRSSQSSSPKRGNGNDNDDAVDERRRSIVSFAHHENDDDDDDEKRKMTHHHQRERRNRNINNNNLDERHNNNNDSPSSRMTLSELVLRNKKDLLIHHRHNSSAVKSPNGNNNNNKTNDEKRRFDIDQLKNQNALESQLELRFRSLAATDVRSSSWVDAERSVMMTTTSQQHQHPSTRRKSAGGGDDFIFPISSSSSIEKHRKASIDTKRSSILSINLSDSQQQQQQQKTQQQSPSEQQPRLVLLLENNNKRRTSSTNSKDDFQDDHDHDHDHHQQQQQQQDQNHALDDVENSAAHLRQVARRHHVEAQLGMKRKIQELISNCHEKLTELQMEPEVEECVVHCESEEEKIMATQMALQSRREALMGLKMKSRDVEGLYNHKK